MSGARERIVREALSWLGTPYHHHGRVRGVGVDCAQILIAVFAAAGLVEEFNPGNYPRDWHLHHTEELYAGWLDRYGRELRADERPQAGDVALFKFGRAYSHGGIVTDGDGTVLHAYLGIGVTLTRLNEAPLAGRPVRFWSIVA